MSNVLVFAEHQHKKFPKTALVAVEAGRQLAAKSGGQCYATVMGVGVGELGNELAEYGVAKVFVVEDPSLEHYVADAYSQALSQIAKDKGCEIVVATASAIGKDLLPRVAVRLDAGMASDITGITDDGNFLRPMYAGNAIATVAIESPHKVVSVRTTAFDPATKSGKAEVEKVDVTID
jgi:electron transfer flavoprotein alpha subunit